MADATGEAKQPPLRVAFDRRLKLEFHGARITSDGGLLAYRELDDALGLTSMAVSALAEGRRGRNISHRLLGLLRCERLYDEMMRSLAARQNEPAPPASGLLEPLRLPVYTPEIFAYEAATAHGATCEHFVPAR